MAVLIERNTCEYCGETNVLINSTPEIGSYCKECLKLVIDNCKTAIKEIDEYGKTTRQGKHQQKRITSEELAELERKKDEALAKLFTGKVY